MPSKAVRESVPKAQSLRKRLTANIMNADLVRPFGPSGTTTGTYRLKPDAPCGDPPGHDEWGDNPRVR